MQNSTDTRRLFPIQPQTRLHRRLESAPSTAEEGPQTSQGYLHPPPTPYKQIAKSPPTAPLRCPSRPTPPGADDRNDSSRGHFQVVAHGLRVANLRLHTQ
jgi:hypothetical protein